MRGRQPQNAFEKEHAHAQAKSITKHQCIGMTGPQQCEKRSSKDASELVTRARQAREEDNKNNQFKQPRKKYGISVNRHQEQRRGPPTPSPACRSPKVSGNGLQKSETRGTEVKESLQLWVGKECHRNVSQVTHRSVPVNGSVVWAWCV